MPEQYKKEKWANLGVDVDNHFKPLYIVSPNKKDHVRHLKAALKDADELYLATDEDREGEAIAWHLLEVLNPKVPVKRMVFHEITPEAIQHAIDNPRDLDRRLVDAQEARRIFDRLYGYEVSPVLWRKIQRGLSAGRVQSVAIRIVVERERERMAFRRPRYWDLDAHVRSSTDARARTRRRSAARWSRSTAPGSPAAVTSTRPASSSRDDVVVLDEAATVALRDGAGRPAGRGALGRAQAVHPQAVRAVHHLDLQEEAGRKLRFSSSQTMSLAQSLYQNGYITYMRTDSTTLSETALNAARIADPREVRRRRTCPTRPASTRRRSRTPRRRTRRSARPATRSARPTRCAASSARQEFRLYELIWQRTIASQMTDARGESVSVRLGATTTDGRDADVRGVAVARSCSPGSCGPTSRRTDDDSADARRQREGAARPARGRGGPHARDGRQATTRPSRRPASPRRRWSSGSRSWASAAPRRTPSTISTILDRGYVRKKGSALVPELHARSPW